MDASSQLLSTLTYDKVTSVVTSTPLGTEIRFKSGTPANTFIAELWIDFDPTAVRQKDTFTLTSATPAPGDQVSIGITVGTNTNNYTYIVETGDTQASIISRLVSQANIDPNVMITSTGNTITVESAIAGQAFTLAIAETGTSITLSAITNVTVNAGTPAHGKVSEMEFKIEVTTDGYYSFPSIVRTYDGQAVPTPLATFVNPPVKHVTSIQALQALRGL